MMTEEKRNPSSWVPWERAGMTQEEWKQSIRFDETDWGWIVMSVGMAIGSGIVFLPIQIGSAGQRIQRGKQLIFRQRIGPGNLVEQRAFPRIGISHQRNGGHAAG